MIPMIILIKKKKAQKKYMKILEMIKLEKPSTNKSA